MGSRARKRAREGGEPEPAARAPGLQPEQHADSDAPAAERPDEAVERSPQDAAPPAGGDAPPLTAAQVELLWLYLLWFIREGQVPIAEEWQSAEGWPRPAEVERAFPQGGWDDLHDLSGVEEAIYLDMLDEQKAAKEQARDAERRASDLKRVMERDAKKMPELRRQAEQARTRADEATGALDEARRAAGAAERERDAVLERMAQLEARLSELEEAARAQPAAEPAPRAPDEVLRELDAELAAHERTRSEREELRDEVGRLGDELARRREHAAFLQRLLAEHRAEDAGAAAPADGAEGEPEEEPRTVLEAVERAASRARHLRFAPRAFESAEDSPFTRPSLILRTLEQLDELAGMYAEEGGMGRSLAQAAREVGITQWKSSVSETARTRWAEDYVVPYDGRTLAIGPHVGLGTGSGAGFVARVYLAADEDAHALIVAHVGRHLPDTTT